MEYEGLSPDDLDNVRALNSVWLELHRGNEPGLSAIRRERLAATPFLLFSFCEHDDARWSDLLGERRQLDMLERRLLILDEPLSGLDPRARYHFKELMRAEKSVGRTVLYSTHLLADAEDLCDQFGILHDGEMKYQGTPAECMQRYQGATLEQAYMKCISA